MRRWIGLGIKLLVVVLMVSAALAQAAGQRLILKDGSYQVVTRYEVKGDRVRYQSAERGNEWEELPYALVDWPATEAWKKAHVPGAASQPGSQSESDAATLDRAAAAERAAEAARQPEVAKGLRLPDESGVWALDNFRDVPEVVEVKQANGNLNRATGHTVQAAPVPQSGSRNVIQIGEPSSGVAFHVPDPVFYVSVDAGENPAPDGALVVDTHGESAADKEMDKRERSDPNSRYVILKMHVLKNLRVVNAIEMSGLRRGLPSEEIVETRRELMPGGHWLKVAPAEALGFGEYVLVELLPSGEVNLDAWDFGVNPRAGENKHPFMPVGAVGP
jgi:hypothetical protein